MSDFDVKFLAAGDKRSWVDEFVIKIASCDRNPSLSEVDAELAFNGTCEISVGKSKIDLRQAKRPDRLFKMLTAYSSVRWLMSNADLHRFSTDDKKWFAELFAQRSGSPYVNRLVSFALSAVGDHLSPEEIMAKDIYMSNDKNLIRRATALIGIMETDHIEDLLTRYSELKKEHRHTIVMELTNELIKRGHKSKKAAMVLLDAIANTKKSTLTSFLDEIREKSGEIGSTISIGYNDITRSLEKQQENEKLILSKSPLTEGGRLGYLLADIGVCDEEMAERMVGVLGSDMYGEDTRAMVAQSLGQMEYADHAAQIMAASAILRTLKDFDFSQYYATGTPRWIIKAMTAFGKLGKAQLNGVDAIDVLSKFAANGANPWMQIYAVKALGMIGTKDETTTKDKDDILAIFRCVIEHASSGSENRVIDNLKKTTLTWYSNVQKTKSR